MNDVIVTVWEWTVAWVAAAAIAALIKLWFDWGDVITAKASEAWNKLIDDLLKLED